MRSSDRSSSAGASGARRLRTLWNLLGGSGRPVETRLIIAGRSASGRRASIARYDNCGEPHGTAGPPILDALKNADVTNTLIVVTRYYGGTKLGAGGLVRAYGEAAKRVLLASGLTELRLMTVIRAPLPYSLLSQLESYLAREGFEITARDFGERVVLTLKVPSDREPDLRAFYTGLVGGKFAYTVLNRGHNTNFRIS